MEEPAYLIRILYYKDPYNIWVHRLAEFTGEDTFEQIGLYGVLPMACAVDNRADVLTAERSDRWTVASVKLMGEFLMEADEVWFESKFVDRRFSLFNNGLHKFGKIFIKKADDSKKKLSSFLTKSSLAIKCKTDFYKYYRAGCIKVKLEEGDTFKIMKQLLSKVKDDKKIMEKMVKAMSNKMVVKENMDALEKYLRKIACQNQGEEYLDEDKISVTFSDVSKILKNKMLDYNLYMNADDSEFVGRAVHKPHTNNTSRLTRALKAVKKSEECKQIGGLTRPQHGDDVDKVETSTVLSKKSKLDQQNSDVDLCKRESDLGYLQKNVKETGGEVETTYDILKAKALKKKDSTSNGGKNMKTLKVCKQRIEYDEKNESLFVFHPAGMTSLQNLKLKKKSILPSVENANKVLYKPADDIKYDLTNAWDSVADELDAEVSRNLKNEKVFEKMFETSETSELQVKERHNIEKALEPNEKQNDNQEAKKIEDDTVKKEDEKSKCEDMNRLLRRRTKVALQSKGIQCSINGKDVAKSDDLNSNSDNSTYNSNPLNVSSSDTISETDHSLDSSVNEHLKKRLNGRLPRGKADLISSIESSEGDKGNFKVNSSRLTFDVTSKFIDKIIARNLMIHSTRIVKTVEPCMQLCDANFTPSVHRGLFGMSILEPKSLQTVSWPCITRGYNLFLVGPMNSGKTMGYLPAVCSLVYDKEMYADLPDTHGPLCVILASSSLSVSPIVDACKCFLQNRCTVLGAHVGCKDSDIQNKLMNGTDILVTTPPFLYRLLGLGSTILDLKRLSLLVVDDADVVNRKFLREFIAIYRSIGKMLKKRVNTEMLVQYVVAGREWSDLLRELSQDKTSVVCIRAYEECVVYSRSPVRLEFMMKDDKPDAVMRIVKKIARKTVIVCCNDDEVGKLIKDLSKEVSIIFSCAGCTSIEDIYKVDQALSEYDLPYSELILVCCDDHLKYFSVTDAWFLVHYSLPVNYSAFCKRFSVLIKNYRNIYQQELSEEREVRVEILLDETDAGKLPKILRYVERCSSVKIPKPLLELSQQVLSERDLAKIKMGVPICNSLLLFGSCQDYWHCAMRHTVDNVYDRPPSWLPRSGWVKFRIIHFHSTAHYSVQVLSYDANGLHVDIQQTDSDLALKMSLYFGDDENKRSHGIPKNGDVCGVELKQSYFERCKVIKVRSYRSTGDPDEVLVNLLDEEKLEVVKACNLLYLPEDLKTVPCHVAQVRILNIIPKDKDECFTAESRESLQSIVQKYDNLYLKGKISLVIGNVLFVDSIKCCQDLKNSKTSVVRFNIKDDLLSNDLVIEDKTHYDSLLTFCKKCDYVAVDLLAMDVDKEIVPTEKKKDVLIEPQWAHLSADSYNQVYISSIENLQQFYVRHLKWQDELDSLTKYIQNYVTNLEAELKFEFFDGDLVVAQFPDDGLFYRARIEDLNESKVRCFFVDHGDWRSVDSIYLFPITNEIIAKLPFQAIECRLLGLKPVGEAWSDMSTNYMCDLCYLGDDLELKELYAWYYLKDKAICTSGFRYAVVVVDTMSEEEDMVVNELFPKVNLAHIVPEEFGLFESLEIRRKKNVNEVEDVNFDAASLNSSEISVTFDFRSLKQILDESNVGGLREISGDCLTAPKIVELDENSISDVVKAAACPATSSFGTFSDASGKNLLCQSAKGEKGECRLPLLSESAKGECLPKLLWCQNKHEITIKIELIGVEIYNIDITKSSLAFNTSVSNKFYKFDVDLFGGVRVDDCKHEAKGLYVSVKLRKLLPIVWPSLVKGKAKQGWISYDHSVFDCSDSDSEDVEDMKRANEEFLRNAVARCDSECESEDGFVHVKDDASHWNDRYNLD